LDQTKVTERSKIYESNLPKIDQENLRDSKELSINVCISQRVAQHDVKFNF